MALPKNQFILPTKGMKGKAVLLLMLKKKIYIDRIRVALSKFRSLVLVHVYQVRSHICDTCSLCHPTTQVRAGSRVGGGISFTN